MPKIKFLTNTRTFLTISSVLRLLNWSNCCCVMGGRTALRGLWEGLWWDGVLGVEMSELVMEAMRCRGLAEDVAKSSGPVGGKMEFSGLGAVEEPLLAWLPAHTQNNHSHPPAISIRCIGNSARKIHF
jgi:hypothetical protein